jgi:hypothetical protein
VNDDETQVDPDLLRKHGRNLEERLAELASAPQSAALRPTLNTSDFGTNQDARDAAQSYVQASDALGEAMAVLVRAGVSHARAMCASATHYQWVDEENGARITRH